MIKLNYPGFWQKRNIISYILLPISFLYFFATFVRKIVAQPIRFDAKVICVGNASVGGTGKTQLVIWIAKFLKNRNVNFVIVTKGYCGALKEATLVTSEHEASEIGDESVLLRQYAPVIAAKKVSEIKPFIDQLRPKVIIFDDGMQNPNFYKDFSILTVDGSRGFGNGMLIPAGPLRQSTKAAANKSDAIVVVGEENDLQLKTKKSVFRAKIIEVSKIDRSKNYLAFSGIGNNRKFFDTLRSSGFAIQKEVSFPDHHAYSSYDIISLKMEALRLNLSLITTEKDYVKILDKSGLECFLVELAIINGEKLQELIDEKVIKTD